MLTGSSDALCLKENNKKKIELASEFRVFHFSAVSSTFLPAYLPSIFISTE